MKEENGKSIWNFKLVLIAAAADAKARLLWIFKAFTFSSGN